MTDYVQFKTSLDVPPPYWFPGVTVNAFVLDAPMAPIQAYCDRYFNLGDPAERGWTYKPAAIWPYILLMIIDYPIMVCATAPRDDPNRPPLADRGYVSQTEIFVALPVLRHGTTAAKLLTNTDIEFALPFVAVGEPMSAICGREMLGLEKLLADSTLEEGKDPNSFKATVKLPGWPSLDHKAMQEMMTFLEIETGSPTPTFRGSSELDSPWTLLSSRPASQAIAALSFVGDFIETASAGLLPTAMHTVSLKQFRDAKDPHKALYQALISCRSKYSYIENFRFYQEDDVNIVFHDRGSFSQILRVFLNLPDNNSPYKSEDIPRKVPARAAFRFNATIDFDNMRTLHTFPVSPGEGLPPAKVTDSSRSQFFRLMDSFLGSRAS
jgi:hypothetical protein